MSMELYESTFWTEERRLSACHVMLGQLGADQNCQVTKYKYLVSLL